jgi:hypothetical protein
LRPSLLSGALLLTTFALGISLTGGFMSSVGGWRFSSRSPWPALVGATVFVGIWFVLARRAGRVRADLDRADRWTETRASAGVAAIAGIAAAVAIRFNTFSAAGADASGYLSEAVMFLSGRLAHVEELITTGGWSGAAEMLAPLGWRPALEIGRQVPTYAPGLPALMAVPHAAGGTIGASLVAPLSLAVAVWCTGAIARRLAGTAAALIAATWLATSPVGLVGAMQPMSDVPVTAAWLACWLALLGADATAARALRRRHALAAGIAAALAVVMRPNLAPLAAVPALYVVLHPSTLTMRARLRSFAIFAAPVAAAGIAIAYLQWRWFGSPLRSGYGTAGEIYAAANIAPNVALYAGWLRDTHGVWLFAAPFAAFLPRRSDLRWLLVFAALVVGGYLIYARFEAWTYLRFLLPALAVATIAVACLVAPLLAHVPSPMRAAALVGTLMLIVHANVVSAQRHEVFRVAGRHSRASLAGRYLEARFAPNAMVVAGEQSGAVRYYTNRTILRWDVATADEMREAIATLQARRHDVWIALDDWEEALFRVKFAALEIGALDWPPAVDAGVEMRTRAWRLRDRGLPPDRAITERLR